MDTSWWMLSMSDVAERVCAPSGADAGQRGTK